MHAKYFRFVFRWFENISTFERYSLPRNRDPGQAGFLMSWHIIDKLILGLFNWLCEIPAFQVNLPHDNDIVQAPNESVSLRSSLSWDVIKMQEGNMQICVCFRSGVFKICSCSIKVPSSLIPTLVLGGIQMRDSIRCSPFTYKTEDYSSCIHLTRT